MPFEKFSVLDIGFFQSPRDHAMFIYFSSHGRTILLLYKDDMIIMGNDSSYIQSVKATL